jgi:hypothetical protein
MVQLTLEQNPRNNQDKRIGIAYQIYNRCDNGHYLIHKTTRAGATTALVAESMNRSEKFLCVVPTNWIADKTVVLDSKKYSDLDGANVIHIPANHECLYNQELCEQYPDLRKLPILPLGGTCSKCSNFDICPVTSVLRHPEANGVVVTYKKLAALMLASESIPNTMAEQVLNELSISKNLIMDEVHEIQFGEYIKYTVYDDVFFNRVKLEKYASIMGDFKYLQRVVIQFNFIVSDDRVKNAIHEVLGGAQDENFWKHHLNKSLVNPSDGITEGESEHKVIVGTYNEIIELTKERRKYGLEMNDILDLYQMMSIVLSKVISVSAIRDKGIIKINLAAVNEVSNKMIQSFVMSMQKEDKRIFLTSATICSFDYGKLFMGGVKPKNLSFGIGGDPMNTNSKMLILADSKKYHAIGRDSRYNKIEEIVYKIIGILERYGDDECLIITINIKEALKLESELELAGHPHSVTYYKAPEMMGVSANERVMIAVGVANKPSNAFDAVTANTEESKRMLHESVHCDTWQAWSRVKDPSAKNPSLVFAIGCSEEECENVITWGYNRKIEIEPYTNGQKKKIKIEYEKQLSKPSILKCKDFDDMMLEASLHKLCKLSPENTLKPLIQNELPKEFPEKLQKPLIYYNKIRGFCTKTGESLGSSQELVKLILNRPDAYAIQKPDGSYLKIKNPASDNDIKKHLIGSLTIGAYQFNPDNMVKWVCFDIDSHAPKNVIETEDDIKKRDDLAEKNMSKMCNFLTNNDIPFVLEESGSPHSYHIWVFLKPVDGKIAKCFAMDIKNESGIDCEVFPKQDKIGKDGYGNLVKVPFATHQKHKSKSQIMINGEFVSDFKIFDIEIMDISEYPLPEPDIKVKKITSKATVKAYTDYRTKVRPCIETALKMQMTGTQGHFMRIAVCREYFNSGVHDPEKLVDLYRGQNDFSYEESMKGVLSIIKKESKNVRCDRLRVEASNFVNCTGCKLNEGGSYFRNSVKSGISNEISII